MEKIRKYLGSVNTKSILPAFAKKISIPELVSVQFEEKENYNIL